MSGTSTPDPSHDQALLAIGRQCSKPSCLLVDFLPFRCQHCEEHFCGEHFLPAGHDCSKYDESKYNRVAPSCTFHILPSSVNSSDGLRLLGPLCNEPVAVPLGQDPNIRMEQHINSQCSVMTGKSKKTKSAPVCSKGKCEKVLFSPIRCTVCTTITFEYQRLIVALFTEMQERILSTASVPCRSQLCTRASLSGIQTSRRIRCTG
jgi:hypothetical protein